MTNRVFAVALLLIVARLLYWKRPTPPGDDFVLAWVNTGRPPIKLFDPLPGERDEVSA